MNLRGRYATHPHHQSHTFQIHTPEIAYPPLRPASYRVITLVCYYFCYYRIALLTLFLFAMTAARCGVDYNETALAAPAPPACFARTVTTCIPIVGAPDANSARIVERALSAFTDDELGSVRAVHFADSDGTLRGFDNGWAMLGDDTTCGNAWGASEHGLIIIRDRADCTALLPLLVRHEACHLMTETYDHSRAWAVCMWG